MPLPRRSLTRKRVALLALAFSGVLLLGGAVRVADVHPLSPTPSPAPVPPDAPAEDVIEQASRHLEHSTVTARVSTNVTEATGTSTDSDPVEFVFKADPERNRLHSFVYQYDGNQTWTTSCSYITDGPSIAKTGTVHSPDRPDFCETGGSDWSSWDRKTSGEPIAFSLEDWDGPPSRSEGLTVSARNGSVVVLRTTSFAAFAAMNGRPVDEDVENGTYTAFVDATTGRLTRVERTIRYREAEDRTRREVTVYRFSKYGTTDVSPPDALGAHSLDELLHDVLVY